MFGNGIGVPVVVMIILYFGILKGYIRRASALKCQNVYFEYVSQ